MPVTYATIDAYLATVPPEQRYALENLRAAIRSAAPDAVEGFSYGIPAFMVNGKGVAGFIATANHLSYFPMSGRIVDSLEKELKSLDISKGTVRFTLEKPLPTTLVKKLVRARLAEIEAKA